MEHALTATTVIAIMIAVLLYTRLVHWTNRAVFAEADVSRLSKDLMSAALEKIDNHTQVLKAKAALARVEAEITDTAKNIATGKITPGTQIDPGKIAAAKIGPAPRIDPGKILGGRSNLAIISDDDMDKIVSKVCGPGSAMWNLVNREIERIVADQLSRSEVK